MLNVFATQFLALFGYFLLRITIGGILVHLGFSHFRSRAELRELPGFRWLPFGGLVIVFSVVELIVGSMFILGALTQIAALVAMAMSFLMLLLRRFFNHRFIPQKLFYLLLFGASISLFITGAGVFAFDLPI